MKKNYVNSLVALVMLVSFQAFSQVNVTFSVDMGATPIDGTGIHVVGSINGWDTEANELTQEGATTIYSGVVSLDINTMYQYKFLNGNSWGTEESPTYPCAGNNGNRFLYVNDAAVSLVTVPFGGCNATGGSSVTFAVDMDGLTVSANGVHLVGTLNDWNTTSIKLEDISGTIYSTTLNFPTPSAYELNLVYKYLNGNAWGTEENLAPLTATCATITSDNRNISGLFDGVTIYDVFDACNNALSTDNLFLSNALTVFYSNERGLVIQSNQVFEGALTIDIYDLSGSNIKSSSFIAINREETILLNSIDKGMYIVKISDEFSHSLVKKVIVN